MVSPIDRLMSVRLYACLKLNAFSCSAARMQMSKEIVSQLKIIICYLPVIRTV